MKRKEECAAAVEAEQFQLEQPEAFESEELLLQAMDGNDQAALDNELDSFFQE